MKRQIVVIGKRWFEKRNGNTYHSVAVYLDGDLLARETFTYGYGSQYEQTALHILHEHSIYNERDESGRLRVLWQVVRDAGDVLTSDVSDVGRKRDLTCSVRFDRDYSRVRVGKGR